MARFWRSSSASPKAALAILSTKRAGRPVDQHVLILMRAELARRRPSTPKRSRASSRASSSAKRGECSSCPAKLTLTRATVSPHAALAPGAARRRRRRRAPRGPRRAHARARGVRHGHAHRRAPRRARSARCRSTWPRCCERHGAEVELHEPDAAALRPHPMVPDELTFDGPPAARRALPRERRRPHAAAQRPRRRRRRRAARRLDAADPFAAVVARRPALRPRRVRHEGRRREHGRRGRARSPSSASRWPAT